VTALADNPILTPAQKRFLEAFVSTPFAPEYRLVGGTALSAFHLRHRASEDLDLFARRHAALPDLSSFVQSVPGLGAVTHERVLDRHRFVATPSEGGTLIVDFVERPEPPLEPPLVIEGLHVQTARDILADKLLAMFERIAAKDFVDVFFLLRDKPEAALWDAVADVERKYGVRGARWILQTQLVAAQRLKDLPPTAPPVTRDDLVARFRELARVLVRGSIAEEG
jgi:predicted nucleotidyltransferase component of viral defense system